MVTIEAQKIQADKDKAARDKARDKFLSSGGTEVQLKIFSLNKDLQQAGFTLGQLRSQGKPDTNRTVVATLKTILSLEIAIARLKGELLSLQKLNKGVQNQTLPRSELLEITVVSGSGQISTS